MKDPFLHSLLICFLLGGVFYPWEGEHHQVRVVAEPTAATAAHALKELGSPDWRKLGTIIADQTKWRSDFVMNVDGYSIVYSNETLRITK